MWKKLTLYIFSIMIVFASICNDAVCDVDRLSKATDAVTSILFDFEAEEFTSYKISDSGFVDIVFARNTPELLYSLILNKLKHHPDIDGVLAGRGLAACSRFR